MATFSVASGVALLYDEGMIPFDPAKQALASTSPAEEATLGSDGFAMRRTAVALAMEDNVGHGRTDLSTEAMEFLEAELAAAPTAGTPKSQSGEAFPTSSGYPYSGWASGPDSVAGSASADSSVPTGTSTSINVLA